MYMQYWKNIVIPNSAICLFKFCSLPLMTVSQMLIPLCSMNKILENEDKWWYGLLFLHSPLISYYNCCREKSGFTSSYVSDRFQQCLRFWCIFSSSWVMTKKVIQSHSMACAENFLLGEFHSVVYGGQLYLVCAVCDVINWRHIHVSKPTFWRSLLTHHAYSSAVHALSLFYVSLHWI